MLRKKIGLALGGGGARGLAHVGVIKVLMKKGIRPDLIVGTSIGSIIGALFATTGDPDAVLHKVHEYFTCECYNNIKLGFLEDSEEATKNDGLLDALSRFLRRKFFNVSLARHQSYISQEDYMENMAFLIDDIDIKDTKIPFAVVCTDVHAGKEVVLTKGSLRQAVAASSAIPGIFPPIDFQGKTLLDGGWVNQLPTKPCRDMGADVVIAVNVASELEQDFDLDTGLDILHRMNSITRNTLTRLQGRSADLVISPDVGKFSWTSFECIEGCMLLGEKAANNAIPAIKKHLKEHPSLFERFFKPS
jgi:NTE family protein